MRTLCLGLLAIASAAGQNPNTASDLAAAEVANLVEVTAKPTAAGWQRLGLVRHLQNKFDPAAAAFSAALKIDPSLWTSHLFLGICRYRTNQFAAAVESLNRADRLGPADGQGRTEIDFWIGAARIASGDQLAGLRSLEKLLARNPGHVEGLQLAAETYAAASARLWSDVAERHFDTAAGQHVHAQVLESEGDTATALDAYRQSRALDARRPGPAGAIGRLLLAGGKPAEALVALEAELALAPHDGEAAQYAGLALIQLNRLAEAVSRLESAARFSPGNPEPVVALAQVHLALGQPRRAADAAALAVKIAPRLAAPHEMLVAALNAADDASAAEAEQQRWRSVTGAVVR